MVEGSAFVAAPLGGMTLAQLGADVIRFDQIGGGLDYHRWPLAADGQSLFWAGLNKGKRSIQIDVRTPEGRELVAALIAAPGEQGGIFLTNFPARGWLEYDALRKRRADLVMVALTGNPDGTSEVDYTVNPATGFPWATGPRNLAEPLNSVLPAWDIALGTLATVGLLAAERHRRLTGEGQLVSLSLSDVAFAMVGNLGRIAEAQLGGRDQQKDGNYLYGAFGHDFETRDGRRVMVVALTARQWTRAEGRDRDRRGVREHRTRDRPRPRHRDRALPGARPDRRAAAPVVRLARPRRRSARPSPAPTSRGVPTRPSASWSRRTRAARPPIRCSPRSSIRASAPT